MLGKHGDIISILPALKSLFDATGERPKVVVSEQYSGVLEGVSYVEPVVVRFEWPKGSPQAFDWAVREFGKAVLPQFWLDPSNRNGVPAGKLVLNMADGRWAIDSC
ncbi:MAG: hypothetical protein AUG89_11505 [Acidobacteria bacterium 13_1_20CM_4_56_7]|nr:MAG: hypothetical protein AUG89_11505 [Acidobacteria bacterium 13_1_20CM_4_56_7]